MSNEPSFYNAADKSLNEVKRLKRIGAFQPTNFTAESSVPDVGSPEIVVTHEAIDRWLSAHDAGQPEIAQTHRPIIYLSGPMHGSKKRPDDREVSCDIARLYAKRLWVYGFGVFSPQGNSEFMYGVMDNSESYMDFDLRVVRDLADCMFMLPGWSNADGARAEKEEADRKGIPVFYTLQEAYVWLQSKNA